MQCICYNGEIVVHNNALCSLALQYYYTSLFLHKWTYQWFKYLKFGVLNKQTKKPWLPNESLIYIISNDCNKSQLFSHCCLYNLENLATVTL